MRVKALGGRGARVLREELDRAGLHQRVAALDGDAAAEHRDALLAFLVDLERRRIDLDRVVRFRLEAGEISAAEFGECRRGGASGGDSIKAQ